MLRVELVVQKDCQPLHVVEQLLARRAPQLRKAVHAVGQPTCSIPIHVLQHVPLKSSQQITHFVLTQPQSSAKHPTLLATTAGLSLYTVLDTRLLLYLVVTQMGDFHKQGSQVDAVELRAVSALDFDQILSVLYSRNQGCEDLVSTHAVHLAWDNLAIWAFGNLGFQSGGVGY